MERMERAEKCVAKYFNFLDFLVFLKDLFCWVYDASLYDVYVDSNLFALGKPS